MSAGRVSNLPSAANAASPSTRGMCRCPERTGRTNHASGTQRNDCIERTDRAEPAAPPNPPKRPADRLAILLAPTQEVATNEPTIRPGGDMTDLSTPQRIGDDAPAEPSSKPS